MIVAIPVWQGRVSPVFDVAGQLLIIEVEDSQSRTRHQEVLPDEPVELRVRRLQALGVQALICGALSRPLEDLLAENGIEVFSRICGEAEEVLEAFLAGDLGEERFVMPGCCGQGGRRHRGRCGRGHGSCGR